jgi:NYN domain
MLQMLGLQGSFHCGSKLTSVALKLRWAVTRQRSMLLTPIRGSSQGMRMWKWAETANKKTTTMALQVEAPRSTSTQAVTTLEAVETTVWPRISQMCMTQAIGQLYKATGVSNCVPYACPAGMRVISALSSLHLQQVFEWSELSPAGVHATMHLSDSAEEADAQDQGLHNGSLRSATTQAEVGHPQQSRTSWLGGKSFELGSEAGESASEWSPPPKPALPSHQSAAVATGAAERALRTVPPPLRSKVLQHSSRLRPPTNPALLRFSGTQVPVRIYWDADNVHYSKRVFSAFSRLLGDVQVRCRRCVHMRRSHACIPTPLHARQCADCMLSPARVRARSCMRACMLCLRERARCPLDKLVFHRAEGSGGCSVCLLEATSHHCGVGFVRSNVRYPAGRSGGRCVWARCACMQVRSVEVFACGGAAAALCAKNDPNGGRPAGVLHTRSLQPESAPLYPASDQALGCNRQPTGMSGTFCVFQCVQQVRGRGCRPHKQFARIAGLGTSTMPVSAVAHQCGASLWGMMSSRVAAGGVLHVDINSDANFKSKTDMRLATHALVSANHDPESHFVIVSNDNDYLPLITSLQALGRRVVVVTFARRGSSITAAADGWIGLNTPKHVTSSFVNDSEPGAKQRLLCSSQQFEDYCVRLSECLVLCSGNIFSLLRNKIVLDPSIVKDDDFPADLLESKKFKRTMAAGFRGDKEWGKDSDEDLFAQLGYLIKARPPSSDRTGVLCS